MALPASTFMSSALAPDHLGSSLLDTVQFLSVPFELGHLTLDSIPGAVMQVLSRGRCCPPLTCWPCPSGVAQGTVCLVYSRSTLLACSQLASAITPAPFCQLSLTQVFHSLCWLVSLLFLWCRNLLLSLANFRRSLIKSQVSQGVLAWKFCYLSIYILFIYSCNTVTTSQIPDHYLY